MHCLDASALVDYLEGVETIGRFVTDHEREPLFSPSVALFETFVGAIRIRGEDGLERARAELDWVEPVDLTVGGAAEAARVDRELHDVGEPIGALDTLIAGVVRDAGGTMVTADPHFERVDGLDVLRYDEEY